MRLFGISSSVRTVLLSYVFFLPGSTLYADDAPLLVKDPHYTKVGFFDMHICNWPERPHFFKVLFSTEKFNDVEKMEVFDPSGILLTVLEKKQFMQVKLKNTPEKRVFMVNMDIPLNAATGWYSVKVTTMDGKEYTARDYVPLTRINRVTNMTPPSNEESIALPLTLSWKKVPGAYFYKVYLRDAWSDKLVFQSKLLSDNTLKIPDGKMEPGGYYSWEVHARDINEHILLGDFHMGSMSDKAFFTIAE